MRVAVIEVPKSNQQESFAAEVFIDLVKQWGPASVPAHKPNLGLNQLDRIQ